MISLKFLSTHPIQVKGITPHNNNDDHVIALGKEWEQLMHTIMDLAMKLLSPTGYCVAQVTNIL